MAEFLTKGEARLQFTEETVGKNLDIKLEEICLPTNKSPRLIELFFNLKVK